MVHATTAGRETGFQGLSKIDCRYSSMLLRMILSRKRRGWQITNVSAKSWLGRGVPASNGPVTLATSRHINFLARVVHPSARHEAPSLDYRDRSAPFDGRRHRGTFLDARTSNR